MSRLWHYIQNGKSQGPVPEEQLLGLVTSGTLRPADLVWREGMANWTSIQDIPELVPPPAAAPVPVHVVAPVAAPVPAPNPYVAPQANMADTAPAAAPAAGSVSANTVEYLSRTKPWVRFMGVLIWIIAVLMLLGAVAVATVGGVMFRFMPPAARIGMAVAYILIALLYFPPAIYLSRYASRIRDLMDDHSVDSLEAALRAQKSFWKYIGLFTLIALVIYILVLIGFLVTTMIMGMGKFL